jgi:hypothetical protein
VNRGAGGAGALAVALAVSAFGSDASGGNDGELDGTIDVTTADAERCDFLDTAKCLFPFPNDYFTVEDDATDTGRRVDFASESMPVNRDGVHMDPAEWNRNDGFSPGSNLLTVVPGLDLDASGAAPSTDIGRSLDEDAPIVVVDAETRRRVPHWAELDASIDDPGTFAPRPLLVRPAVNLLEGHRYVVALRDVRDERGDEIEASPAFRAYRDRLETEDAAVERRRGHMEDVFETLADAGIEREDLFLAWDFTVASQRNLSERLLHIRDDAFEQLGDAAPEFTVSQVDENPDANVARRVQGTFRVPLYLTGAGEPGSRFDNGADGLPQRHGDFEADFRCTIPEWTLRRNGEARPARPAVYGHGLLGAEDEVDAGNVASMADEHGFVFCATKWIGLSEGDVGNAVEILNELGRFPTMADRLQQGILNTLFLGRLMIHEDGLVSDPAFQGEDGEALVERRELFYDGNSQGGIMGGAATAVALDWRRAVLGVPAMNYSTLLHRSIDFDVYEAILDPAYPDELDRTLGISLVQMLWDRGEANGYAQHMTEDPYPGTPEHAVLIHEAFGDHQVANVATEVEARTIGARAAKASLADGRSLDEEPLWGIRRIRRFPYDGSAIVVWDSGTPPSPPGNVAPMEGTHGKDPHEDPRASTAARRQKAEFLKRGGRVVDVCEAEPCTADPVE